MEVILLLMLGLALRVIAVAVCINKAKQLNRSTGGWGFFGFISPLLALIWIRFMEPIED